MLEVRFKLRLFFVSEPSLKDLNPINAFKEVPPQERFFLPFVKGQNLLCIQICFHFFELRLHASATVPFGDELDLPYEPELKILSYLQKPGLLKFFCVKYSYKLSCNSCRLIFPPVGSK